jgi:competence/damage-inducible protein CinA-like protein
MKCGIVSIGDELLIGQVVNTNAAVIGQYLTGVGIEVMSVVTIGDSLEEIQKHIEAALDQWDIVVTTGGLGPTRDDMTSKAVASIFGVELVFSKAVFDRLAKIIRRFGKEPTAAHRAQCYLPTNAELIQNTKGTAPGMYFKKEGKHLFVLPGIPYEMRHLMESGVLPRLKALFPDPGQRIYRTFSTVGEGESRLAERIEDIEDHLPPFLKIAYLPSAGRVRIRLMGAIHSDEEMKNFEITCEAISLGLGEFVFAEEDITLPEAIGRMLLKRHATLSVAESCTGGFVGHLMTSVAGSSEYFVGGAITYSNALKHSILGVQLDTLEKYGAVSQQTVEEMATGAVRAFRSDYAVAITGIAGPGGGSDEKPVGTVWIAVASSDEVEARHFRFIKDRTRNIELSAIMALNMVRKFLKRKA